MITVRLRVFLIFALGYFVSYLFRGVNIGFAPYVTREIGLGPADLGLLTSVYFFGFAAAQIPAGVLLDRFGSRRVDAALLLVAAAGILVYGAVGSLAGMMIGRLMIGVGVSVAFGGACKAIAQQFAPRHLPLLYGLVLAIGGFGGVLVGTPLSWLLTHFTWRMVCFGLAAFTAAVSVALMVGTPETPEPERHTTILTQLRGTGAILASRCFWRVAPFSVISQGVFYAAQSLWVAAYMRDVSRLNAGEAARLVSILGVAMMAGSVGFGLAARALERRGLSVLSFSGIGMGLVRAGSNPDPRRRAAAAMGTLDRLRLLRGNRHPDLCDPRRGVSRRHDRPREHDAYLAPLRDDLRVPGGHRSGARALAATGWWASGVRPSGRLVGSGPHGGRERDPLPTAVSCRAAEYGTFVQSTLTRVGLD